MARVKSNDSPTCMPPSTVKAQFCCPGRWGAVVTVAFRQWPTPGAYWKERLAFSSFGNLCFFVGWFDAKIRWAMSKDFLRSSWLFWDVHQNTAKIKFVFFSNICSASFSDHGCLCPPNLVSFRPIDTLLGWPLTVGQWWSPSGLADSQKKKTTQLNSKVKFAVVSGVQYTRLMELTYPAWGIGKSST